MGKLFSILVGIAGIIGAIYTVRQYYASPPPPPVVVAPRPSDVPRPTIPPTVDLTPDPSTAAQTKAFLRSSGTGAGIATYSVTNLGWADNMTSVAYSLWAVVNGRIARLDERQTAFIGKGEYVVGENIRAPMPVGKMVICVSYVFKGRRANILDFYSNENASSFQRQTGEMSKFRESLRQVDGASDMCKSMPAPAANLI